MTTLFLYLAIACDPSNAAMARLRTESVLVARRAEIHKDIVHSWINAASNDGIRCVYITEHDSRAGYLNLSTVQYLRDKGYTVYLINGLWTLSW